MPLAPFDDAILYDQLDHNPYPIYRRLRAEAPVLRVKSVGRTLLTRAEDTRRVKEDPVLFSSDDPGTPMLKALEAHTLMRKDGAQHRRERMAMAPTFSPKNVKSLWAPRYQQLASTYLDRLPKDEPIDLFATLAGPLAARILAEALGLPEATDADMQFWSQAIIDGAGNFAWRDEPFERVAKANVAMNAEIDRMSERLRAAPDETALSVMINAEDPIATSQVRANIKIAIGGGINEPRDAFLTTLFGLLTNPDQLEAIRASGDWLAAFEEGVRWVAPIQASSRLVAQDTQIRGYDIPKGDVVMTIQASANRDEALFEEPERFNALRAQNPHQAFGGGPHHCMGAQLARATVGRALLPLIFERFPNMKLVAPEAVIWRGFGFRGPIVFPVRLH